MDLVSLKLSIQLVKRSVLIVLLNVLFFVAIPLVIIPLFETFASMS